MTLEITAHPPQYSVGRYTFKDLRYTLCRRYIVASRRAARIIVYALELQKQGLAFAFKKHGSNMRCKNAIHLRFYTVTAAEMCSNR
jgi:hypothetical protein